MTRSLIGAVLLLLAAPRCFGRLGETVQQIEARYGKPLKGVNAESPATVAGVYAKTGFQIIVGFYRDKSYYEKIHKLDPQNPKVLAEISAQEQETLLKANCAGCNWTGHATTEVTIFGGTLSTTTTYDRSDGLARVVYSTGSKVLTIRSLEVEKADEAKRKRQEQEQKAKEQEHLKGF